MRGRHAACKRCRGAPLCPAALGAGWQSCSSVLLPPAPLPRPCQVKGLVSLVYDGVWFIFWLSCAAALSNMLSWSWWGSSSRLQASVAFSWLTW